MRTIYLCWIDDVKKFISSYEGKIELLEAEFDVKFIIDEHYNTENFAIIAKNIDDDLIFLVDYNLKDNNGNGIDGDEVIKLIREHHDSCQIIFYSSKATQQELRELVSDIPNVTCVMRESLQEVLTDIANGDFKC